MDLLFYSCSSNNNIPLKLYYFVDCIFIDISFCLTLFWAFLLCESLHSFVFQQVAHECATLPTCACPVVVCWSNTGKFGCVDTGLAFALGPTCCSPSAQEGQFFYKEPSLLSWQRSSCACIPLGSVALTFTTGSTVESGILLSRIPWCWDMKLPGLS